MGLLSICIHVVPPQVPLRPLRDLVQDVGEVSNSKSLALNFNNLDAF